jgi:ankyrin repeat protein
MDGGISIASGVAGLVTLALQVSDEIYKYVKAISERAKNARELHAELLLLGEVLSQLRDFINAEEAKGRDFDRDSILSRAITECKTRIERIGDKIRMKEGNKLVRAVDYLTWPFKQEQVLQLMENLRRFRSTFEFAVTIKGREILSKTSEDAEESLKQMLELSKKTEDMLVQQGLAADALVKQSAMLGSVIFLLGDLESAKSEIREMSYAMHMAEERERRRLTTEVLDWLLPLESLHKHNGVQAKRAPGTGQWFLEKPEFRQWLEDESERDFLCIGSAGTGKTILCSLVIDELRKKHKGHEIAIIHYYCDYSEQHAQTPENLARSLLRQLCASCASLPSAISEFHEETRLQAKDETWFQELQKRLHRVLATFSICYLIVDAFDETEAVQQRPGLLNVIQGIRSAPTKVKVFATTRPYLTSHLESKLVRPTSLHVTASETDLRHYLGNMIDRHPDADDIMDDTLKQEILDKLCENANGIFLLPSLHIRSILDQPTRADVKAALNSISTDLPTAFRSTLDRINGMSTSRRRVAYNTLMWISHARQPLKVDELQHALAVRLEDRNLDKDNFLSLRTILDSCCGLVEIDKERNIIRLVHKSLEEYLQSQDHDLFQNADLTIVRTALKYMSFGFLRSMLSVNLRAFEATLKQYPFLHYACTQWGHHARELEVSQYEDLVTPLLTDGACCFSIARVKDSGIPFHRKWLETTRTWAFSPGGGAAISLATSFGLTDLIHHIIMQHKVPNLSARNIHGSTPLHEAAILGYDDTADALIAHGADPLDKNKGKAIPFFLAVSYSRLSMVKTLLKHGRDQLDVQCKGGSTSLHRAADLGHPELLECLLREGALIAAHDDRGSTPLHHAALRGHLIITKMLVLGGALVDVEATNGFTALDEATTAGHTDIAEFLIKNKADVMHRAGDRWTPLHRAARGAHVDTVVLLLERGARILERDLKGNTPLHHAARAGSLETCVQLLEYDPSFKKQQLVAVDHKGETARSVAFYTAHYSISKYLRACEHAVLGTAPSTSNKINLAIEDGDLVEVQRLLDTEPAALEAPDEDGQPPLHVAVQESQLAIAEALLSRGANIHSAGYHGWHALHIASSMGNLDMVNLCLSHSASLIARTSTRQTALHKSASSGSVAVLHRLIAAGADLQARNERGMTCLHIAAHKNDEVIAKALVLEYGLDVLARDRFGYTARQWAERGAGLTVGKWLKAEELKARTKLNSISGNSRRSRRATQVKITAEDEVEEEDGIDDRLEDDGPLLDRELFEQLTESESRVPMMEHA